MRHDIKTGLIALITLGLATTALASTGRLDRAHEAFAAGDFLKMTSELKAALQEEPGDPLVRENALSLLRKSYEIRGKEGVPVDWHLPQGMTRLNVAVRRSDKQTPEYALRVDGVLTRPGLIQQLKARLN